MYNIYLNTKVISVALMQALL